jgi:hypothetical protein
MPDPSDIEERIRIELVGVGVPLAICAFASHRREERGFSERRAGA